MSIPYNFETPIPRYFKDNGFFAPSNKMRSKNIFFLQWAFSRCSGTTKKVTHDGEELYLQPFEFIFGREVCCMETGLTDREVRTQVETYQKLHLMTLTKNSKKNRFSCFRWNVEATTNCFAKKRPTERPTEIILTQNSEVENGKVSTNQTTNKRPTERPQSRSKTIDIDIDQGYRPIFTQKPEKGKTHLNGEHVAYLEGLDYSPAIASQVIEAFNTNPPLIKSSLRGLIKVWAANTKKAYDQACKFDTLKSKTHNATACNKYIEFSSASQSDPIIIKYTEENASSKIVEIAEKLGIKL